MTSVHDLRDAMFSDEARARRQARRNRKLSQLQAQLREAVNEANEAFTDRYAYAFADARERGASRKIAGNAGASAVAYVTECLGEFQIQGTIKSRFAGMERIAGAGAHGITEGTIVIDVELRPTLGMTQIVEVPVTVKNGYMQQPGIFFHHGTPYVLSQSAIDDIMDEARFIDDVKPERKNMFCPPANLN